MMIKRLLILFVCINLYTNLFSQAGSFVTHPVNARVVSLGGTYIAQENNNAVFTNLAASSISDKKLELDLNYRPWMNDISDDYKLTGASAYYSINKKNSLAVGFKNYSMPHYKQTDENGNDLGSYKPSELNFAIGYAYKISDITAVSLSLHYLESDLGANYDAGTIMLDLGFKSKYKKLDYGFVVRNLGPKLKFDNQDVSLPLTIGGGVAYSEHLNLKHKIATSLDCSYLSVDDNSGYSAGVGCEYTYNSILSVRTGYHFIDDSIGLNTFSLGCGVHFKGASLDFGWLLSDNALNNNYSISCSFRINKK